MPIKSRHFLAFCLTFLLLVATSLWGTSVAKPPPPDYFPLPNRAVWEYKSTTSTGGESQFTVTVVGIEKRADGSSWYKLETKSNKSIYDWYSKPPGLVLIHREMAGEGTQYAYDGKFEPPLLYLKNPLKVGEQWTWKGQRPGVVAVAVEQENTVVGVDKIKVPAGEFDGIKVVTQINQGGANLKKTYWYVDQVGLVKGLTESESFTATSELLKFNFKQ